MLFFLIVITGQKLLLFGVKQSHNITLERQAKTHLPSKSHQDQKTRDPAVPDLLTTTGTSNQETRQFLSGLGILNRRASHIPLLTMDTFEIAGGWCRAEG